MESNADQRVAVVIEDDDDIRHLLETVLIQAGFRVVATSNGADGVAAVRANDPVVTTLDVNMPGMDGFEAARRIREFSQTYIVMLTALNEEIDTLQGLEAGADDYVNKPFRPRELRARIEAMLRRPRIAAIPTSAAAVQAPSELTPQPYVTPQVAPQPVYQQPPVQAQPVQAPPVQAPPVQAPPVYAQPFQAQPFQTQPAQAQPPQAQPVQTRPPQAQPATVPAGQPAPTGADEFLAAPSQQDVAEPGDDLGGDAVATQGPGRGEGWMEHNGLWLNIESRVVQVGSDEIDLTRSEFDLMAALLESNRRVRTKADLVLLLRGESYVTSHFISEADKRAIEVHMGNLRKKLGDTIGAPRWIETVRGVGYRLTAAN